MARHDLGHPVETFRISVRSFFRLGLGIGVLVAFYLLVSLLLKWEPMSILDAIELVGVMGLLAAGGGVIMASFGFAMSRLWTVKVGPLGISGCTFSGWPIRATWDEIEEVAEVDVRGIGYMAVRLRGRRAQLWVPMEMNDGERFDTVVSGYLSPSHPFYEWVAVSNSPVDPLPL